jgi:fatty-acid desaturase
MEFKIKGVLVLNHFLFLYGLFYFLSPLALLYLALGYLFIVKLGIECGYHRLFSHRAFKTTESRKNLLLLLGSLAGFGPALAWVGVHRLHHRHSDSDKDPHGHMPAYRIWLTLWRDFIVPRESVRDLLRDKWQVFFFKYYFSFLIFSYVLIGFISPLFLFFGVAGASVIGIHAAGLVNTVCHRFGSRNFNLEDRSHNNKWVNLLVGGNGLHNNHHANPSAWDYRVNKGDVDIQALMIKWFLKAEPSTEAVQAPAGTFASHAPSKHTSSCV